MKEIAVVFYSRTGRTKRVAEIISSTLSGDMIEVQEDTSRKGVLGFITAGRDAVLKREVNIFTEPEFEIEKYKLIFIGTPVWASGPSVPIQVFIKKHDFSNKVCALFATTDCTGLDRTFRIMRSLLGNTRVIGEKGIRRLGGTKNWDNIFSIWARDVFNNLNSFNGVEK